jgi:hypothetical protein
MAARHAAIAFGSCGVSCGSWYYSRALVADLKQLSPREDHRIVIAETLKLHRMASIAGAVGALVSVNSITRLLRLGEKSPLPPVVGAAALGGASIALYLNSTRAARDISEGMRHFDTPPSSSSLPSSRSPIDSYEARRKE